VVDTNPSQPPLGKERVYQVQRHGRGAQFNRLRSSW